jgi:hypothetical protein
MEPREEPLRQRLLAQQAPTPEQLARYRQEVEALLEEVRRRQWWKDAGRTILTTLAVIVFFPLAALFGLAFFYQMAGGKDFGEAWCPATATLVCLAGGVAVVRLGWLSRREDTLLLEVKRLRAQGLELEERLRRESH